MAVRLHVWKSQPEAEGDEPVSVPAYRRSNVPENVRGHLRKVFSQSDLPRTPTSSGLAALVEKVIDSYAPSQVKRVSIEVLSGREQDATE